MGKREKGQQEGQEKAAVKAMNSYVSRGGKAPESREKGHGKEGQGGLENSVSHLPRAAETGFFPGKQHISRSASGDLLVSQQRQVQ